MRYVPSSPAAERLVLYSATPTQKRTAQHKTALRSTTQQSRAEQSKDTKQHSRAQAKPSQANPTQPNPAQAKPSHAKPSQAKPSQPNPIQPNPTQPHQDCLYNSSDLPAGVPAFGSANPFDLTTAWQAFLDACSSVVRAPHGPSQGSDAVLHACRGAPKAEVSTTERPKNKKEKKRGRAGAVKAFRAAPTFLGASTSTKSTVASNYQYRRPIV